MTLKSWFCFSVMIIAFLTMNAQPKVIAHRGYWKCEGSAQNSLAALQKSSELKVWGSEFDVLMTVDGKLVVNHDDCIDGYRIETTKYEKIKDKKLKNGETLPLLEQDYISQGKLKVIFVNFPLERKSMQGALIAKCIPDKNYYEFIKTAFKNQREWYFSSSSEKIFSDYAAHNGLSKTKAAECLKNDDNAKDIIEIRQQAIDKLKISGTPSFLLTSGKEREVIYGVPSYESLQKLLDKKLLSSKN